MKLTTKQSLAASHKDGPCLVLAVPGAGKTTMILKRIEILSEIIDPKKILSLTFSKTQAEDMKMRYIGDKSNFMTIHAFCYLIIRNYLKKSKRKLNLLENDNLYNKYNLVKEIYYKINNKKISDEDLKEFFLYSGFMKNSMKDISYLKISEVKNIEKIYYEYESFKRNHNYIDFDDMQLIAYKLINDNPTLLRAIKNKYKYFQLDEGQDTSLLQFKILEKIIYPENNIMIVADDDQSIYSFRAADPDYLLNFKKSFPNTKIITMDQNHRSQKNIVNISNEFIKLNKDRYDKELFTDNKKESEVNLIKLKDSKDTYKYIIKNLDYDKQNAVLFRNNISALNMISFLMEDDNDFSIDQNAIDFFDSIIIDDLIKIIKFSEDFNDVELFSEIYYKIKTYLRKEDISNLNLKPKNYNIFDLLLELNLDEEKNDNLMKKEKELKHIRKLSLDKKISFIYNYMGYKDYIKLRSNKYHEIILNKELYIESIMNFTKNLKTIDEFYEKVDLLKKTLNNNTNSNLILSTIHKSKGLEYDNVFIIDLIKGEFPMIVDSLEKDMRIEEERRIFYVAMTRAKHNLHILTLKKRNNIEVYPSEFFDYLRVYKKDLSLL